MPPVLLPHHEHRVHARLFYGLMADRRVLLPLRCLYAERKDRSILFWKSLPVSDTMTVLSKLLVALIAVPLVVYVLALATNLLAFLVFKVAIGFGDEMDSAAQDKGIYTDEDITGRIPMGRFASPDDVARAIAFLADEQESAFINGHTLTVDGGWTADGSWESLRKGKR